jgi:hypothetical protein
VECGEVNGGERKGTKENIVKEIVRKKRRKRSMGKN